MKLIPGTIFSVLLLSGCGGGSTDFGPTEGIHTFDGSWSNGCEYDQFSGTGDDFTLEIDGSSATLSGVIYETSDCTGAPIGSVSAPFSISYPGVIVLSDCYNGHKVDVNLEFPITVDGVEYSEAEYAALPADEQGLEISGEYDLLCTNQAGTILYSGDEATGDGTSDATRPTSADLTYGLTKVQ